MKAACHGAKIVCEKEIRFDDQGGAPMAHADGVKVIQAAFDMG